MPISIKATDDLFKLERRLKDLTDGGLRSSAVEAVNKAAFKARRSIIAKMPEIFDRPTPTTLRSVLVDQATLTETGPIIATVRIKDEAPKGVPPSRYLMAEAIGGVRAFKRSERALEIKGFLSPSQQIVPASGMALDAYGNVPGSLMTKILSRVSGLSEVGYQGNATRRSMARRRRKGLLVSRATGTEYFVARSKRGGEPIGIYQLVGKGKVVPVLWFVDRRPQYGPRFPFRAMVEEAAGAVLEETFMGALLKRLREG